MNDNDETNGDDTSDTAVKVMTVPAGLRTKISRILELTNFEALTRAEIEHFVDGYRGAIRSMGHPEPVADAVCARTTEALLQGMPQLRETLIAVYASALTDVRADALLKLYESPLWTLHNEVMSTVAVTASQQVIAWLNGTINGLSEELAKIFDTGPGAPPALIPPPQTA